MQEIIALFTVFSPHLPTSTLRQLTQVVFALLAMTGRVTMLNISRWTSQGGSYRTIQRLFNTVLPWSLLYWMFFSTHLFDPEGVYILAADETIKSKSGKPTIVREGPGRPQIYGERFNPRQIDPIYRNSTEINGNIRTEVYQINLRHRKFPELLNAVCILKTNLTTKQQSHILLFSSDLSLEAEKMMDYYSLRFQIEFNFRDAKQYWGLQDAMNVNKIPVTNAANLSMFMVSVSAKLTNTFGGEKAHYSVLDLKSHYRGLKYMDETLKILPQKPEPFVIENITQHLSSIGAIHYTHPELNPG